jgi:hypothetical protein
MTARLFRLLGVVLVLAALAHPIGAMTQRDRSAYLDWMLKSLPSAPQFEQWQQRTGELPPDFEAFPRNNFLPDGAIATLYPEHDFASMGQVAFTVQTVVDHLLTVPQVDKTRIAMTGYSRAGKMALIAAALDERVAAVVAGSTGVGGVTPWRLSGEYGMGEGVESTTRSS